jgi:RNA polymerase sigma-70 factor, ECF subfamily
MTSLSTEDLRRSQFEALVERVYEPLQRYAGRRTDPDTAHDVVADVLLVLWRRLDDVPTDAVLPWCYGAARRVLANTRRGDARRSRLVERLAVHSAEVVDTMPLDTMPLDGIGGDGALDEALRGLRAVDREVLFLWAWEQLEAHEIALVVGTTPNAASIRLHRAKKRLRQQVELGEARRGIGKSGIASGHPGPEGSEET